MSRDAIIVGYSGHAYVVLDILLNNNYRVEGYCDKIENRDNPFKLKHLGSENDSHNLEILRQHDVFICIGSNSIRQKIFENLVLKKVSCPSLMHSGSIVSKSAHVMEGSIIMPGAVINAFATIGNAVICNSATVIEHECVIGNYVHIAPGTVLAGNVTVGSGTFIGANTVVKQGVNIGKNVTIGAGSVIVKNVPDGALVYGNPGKVK